MFKIVVKVTRYLKFYFPSEECHPSADKTRVSVQRYTERWRQEPPEPEASGMRPWTLRPRGSQTRLGAEVTAVTVGRGQRRKVVGSNIIPVWCLAEIRDVGAQEGMGGGEGVEFCCRTQVALFFSSRDSGLRRWASSHDPLGGGGEDNGSLCRKAIAGNGWDTAGCVVTFGGTSGWKIWVEMGGC